MSIGQIFTKIGNYIENRQIFMLLNCNCAKLANFEDLLSCLGGRFSCTQCIFTALLVKILTLAFHSLTRISLQGTIFRRVTKLDDCLSVNLPRLCQKIGIKSLQSSVAVDQR